MRTTITIPDEYYDEIEKKYKSMGYTSVNDYILGLIRSGPANINLDSLLIEVRTIPQMTLDLFVQHNKQKKETSTGPLSGTPPTKLEIAKDALVLHDLKKIQGGNLTSPLGFSKCQICRFMKEDVKPVQYLQDGEKTTDNMCPGCERKIPDEMRIKDISINGFVGNSVETGDLSQSFNPVPKPVKKVKGK